MNNIDISVIIPAYNSKEYIGRCIESVLDQNGVSIEVIVVDDGSTDNTLEICADIALNNSNVHIFHQDNNGISSARNKGLDNAKGKYIAFIDSDDYLPQNSLSCMIDIMNEKDVDVVIGGFDKESPNGELVEEKKVPVELKSSIFNCDVFWNYNNNKQYNFMFTVVWGKLYRKEIWDKIRFGKGICFAEDEFILPDLIDECSSFYCLDQCVYVQTLSEGSLVRSDFNYSKLNAPESKLQTCSYLIERNLYACAIEKWSIAVGEILVATKLSKDLKGLNKSKLLQKESAVLGKKLFGYMSTSKKVKFIGYLIVYPIYEFMCGRHIKL